MGKPSLLVSSFVVKDSSILLARNKEGKLVIPFTEVKPFEPIFEAARRSLLEEMGIAVVSDDILFVQEWINQPAHYVTVFVLGNPVIHLDQEISLQSDDQYTEAFWVDTRELDKYQDECSHMTIDALYKFSLALKSRGMVRR